MVKAQGLGLGIESSCDETSVALIEGDGSTTRCIANLIYSQTAEHAPFRGVVPEIASRSHLEKINPLFAALCAETSLAVQDLAYVAVTARPGLVGSLMIGGLLAKSLNVVYGTPMIDVDHVEAHFYALALEQPMPEYPFLGLLLSGGNSAIFRVNGLGSLQTLVDTIDDALGEAFDKAASILDLPYPGGVHVERLAETYTGDMPSLLPRLMKAADQRGMFSFSGVKTAVLRSFRQGEDKARICRDFQDTVFELVERNLAVAVAETGIRTIVAAGGVLANQTLRRRLLNFGQNHNVRVLFPEQKKLCTDNAGMIAALGWHLYRAGRFADLDYTVSSVRDTERNYAQ